LGLSDNPVDDSFFFFAIILKDVLIWVQSYNVFAKYILQADKNEIKSGNLFEESILPASGSYDASASSHSSVCGDVRFLPLRDTALSAVRAVSYTL
jgi:hypothetical protein